jgi:hypothetical protein
MFYHGLAAGVFVGNFLLHWAMGDFHKGLTVGLIAAVLVEIVGGVILIFK